MRLILIEQCGEIKSRREVPPGIVTIGRRDATITPLIGVEAISRLHATITPISAGWLVEDGNGIDRSRNGIYANGGIRVDQQVLTRSGDFVDIVPPRDGIFSRLIVEDSSEADQRTDQGRETTGFEYVASDEFHQDIQQIKTQVEATGQRVSSIESEIVSIQLEISSLKKVNEIQDLMIRRSRFILAVFFVSLLLILAAAVGNEKHRSELLSIAGTLVTSVLIGYVAMVQKKTE